MKRVLSIASKEAHHKALKIAYGTKRTHPGPDCAFCRNSACQKQGAVFAFVCLLKRVAHAATCPDYSDCREPAVLNPQQLS